MDEFHSAWSTPMTNWAYPSTDMPHPHPWDSRHAKEEFGDPKCDLWRKAHTVMCEAHSRPENVINECYNRQTKTSVFEWLHEPANRQRPPQSISQLLNSGLFPQTLRLPDPNDAFNRTITGYLNDLNTLSYLRVVLKPGRKYHGSEFQREPGETIRTPGFNDKVQYKPGMWQGYAGTIYPTCPEAAVFYNRSKMSKTALRRSTLAVSDTAFLHTIKNELRNGEGREILYRMYSLLPACMVDIKGHLRDLKLEQRSDHFMSPWKDTQLLTYSTFTDSENKLHRVTHLDFPKFIVLTFGDRYDGITTPMCADWSVAPKEFPLELLYCEVEKWAYNAERCIMETSLRMHCAWSELHYIVYERHRHRLRTLYLAISKSFDHLVQKSGRRPVFNDCPDLWRDCHTEPCQHAQNPRPCSFDKDKHFQRSRWTCRENGHFTRFLHDGNIPPTNKTASLPREDAGQR